MRCKIFAILVAAVTSQASAQTEFRFPAEDTLFRRPMYPSECNSAVKRSMIEFARGKQRDTIRVDSARETPAQVRIVAERCRKGITASAAQEEPGQMFALSLTLGEIDSAWIYLQQWRAAASPGDSVAHGTILQSAFRGFLSAMPARPGEADRLLPAIDSLPVDTLLWSFNAHVLSLNYALSVNDTARIARDAEAILSWYPRLPPDVRTHPGLMWLCKTLTVESAEILARRQLRTGGATALHQQARARVVQVMGDEGVDWLQQRFLFGTPASRITGGLWFIGQDTALQMAPQSDLPIKGRVSMIVFVDPLCHPSGCATASAVLRRIQQQFADSLDVIFVSRTRAVVEAALHTDTIADARAIRHYLLDRLGNSVRALNVQVTKFIREPAPDRRRVDYPVDIFTQYKVNPLFMVSTALIDRDGIVATYQGLSPETERLITEILSALTGRQ